MIKTEEKIKKIERKEIVKLLRRLQKQGYNKTFWVRFIKKTTGESRKMTCRFGVTSHLAGGSLSYDPKKHGLLTVFDMSLSQYRSISLKTLTEVHMDGRVYKVV